jgi:hypothetical protein
MRARSLVLALATGVVVACGDQGPDTVAGTYTLRTVSGEGPPWAEFVNYGTNDGLLTESVTRWTNDTLRLNEDATLRWIHVWERTVRAYDAFTGALVDSGVTTTAGTQHGTHSLSGSTVELRLENGAEYAGSWKGDRLTLEIEGHQHVYRRWTDRF